MRFAEARIERGTHQIINIKALDNLQRVINRSVVEDVNSKVAKGLCANTFKAGRNIAGTVECDDVHCNS